MQSSSGDARRKKKVLSKASNARGNVVDDAQEFRVVNVSLVVSIAPIFAKDPLVGVAELLDSMIMRFIPALQGVMLAHANIQFLAKTATIKGDSPYAICEVSFEATVWSPQVGMTLIGRINLCSPDHVSLLVHRTFNASIPRRHMQTDQWEFEYGPAENDPEFTRNDDEPSEFSGQDVNGHGGGRWIHRITADRLGGPGGFLKFTVIGLTVANEMLSLTGSLLDDPFLPERMVVTGPKAASVSDEEDEWAMAKDSWEESDEEAHEGSAGQAFKKIRDMVSAKKSRASEKSQVIALEKKRKREKSKSNGGYRDEVHTVKKTKKSKRT